MEQDDNPQQPGLAETICVLVARARADVDRAVACQGIVDCTTGVAVVRQVLGKLPITADGVVFGMDVPDAMFAIHYGDVEGAWCSAEEMDGTRPPSECYTTRAAAQAALDAKEATQ